VNTAIEEAGRFTPAEDYHQKHYLKRRSPAWDILLKRYREPQALFRSTDAARLNGYLGCNADPHRLGENLRRLAFPARIEQKLFDALTLTCRNFRGSGCALPPLD